MAQAAGLLVYLNYDCFTDYIYKFFFFFFGSNIIEFKGQQKSNLSIYNNYY